MSIKNFSAYSAEGGMLSIDDILNQDFTKKTNKAFLTDLNTLSGVPEFMDKCEQRNIQPVVGVTLTVQDDIDGRLGNITLYAKNENGFANLKKIVSSIVKTDDKEKFVSFNKIIDNSEDLIALTGGYDTVLYNSIAENNKERATKHLYALRKSFKNDIFFEIQKTNDPLCDNINNNIVNLSKKGNVELLATNNNRMRGKAHYSLFLEKAHVIKGINNKKNALNESQFLPTDYVKKGEEMAADFVDYNENIASLKNFFSSFSTFSPFSKMPEIPDFPGIDNDDYLFDVLEDKYKDFIKRIPEDKRKEYDTRLKEEVQLVKDMGFAKYFVIFMKIAENKIEGQKFNLRGSAASFLITHVLGLSDVDPLKYGLLSERFLNKNRLIRNELPDIDLESNDVDAVAKYLVDTYGIQNTAYLSAISTVKAKTQITMAKHALERDMDRTPLDANGNERVFPEEEFKLLSKVITSMYGHKDMNFSSIAEKGYVSKFMAQRVFNIQGDWNSREFKQEYYKISNVKNLIKNNPNMNAVIGYVKNLDSIFTGQGVSSGSLVVGNKPISDYFSTHYVDKDLNGTKKDVKIAVEAGKKYVEKLGLIKLDVLSNLYLDKLSKSYQAIGLNWDDEGGYDNEYSKKEVFDMIGKGRTATLNQIKSEQQGALAKRIKVGNFNELVILLALLRPGVGEESIQQYVENKANENLQFSHPKMKEILEPTHGVLVFEEQIMEIAQKIGGLSKEESDDFRSIIKKVNGDKNKEKNKNYYKLEEMKTSFVERAKQNGMPDNVVKEAFDILDGVGGYTFSKAHSLSYAALTYKQAVVDVEYPAEYIKYFLLNEKNNIEEKEEFDDYIKKTVAAGRSFLSADINRSLPEYKTRNKGTQKFIDPSLNVVTKDEKLSNVIAKERIGIVEGKKAKINYENIYDFVERTIFEYTETSMFSLEWGNNTVNTSAYKTGVENLIRVGAFDSIAPKEMKDLGVEVTRSSLLESLNEAVNLATQPFLDKDFEYKISEMPMSAEMLIEEEKHILGYSPEEIRINKKNSLKKKVDSKVEEKNEQRRGSRNRP